jgi:hypothetical protein
MKKLWFCFLGLVLFFSPSAFSQQQYNDRTLSQPSKVTDYKDDSYFSKPVYLIDLPTASILRGGDLRTSLRLYEEGGALSYLSVGISNRMMFGVSYGGLNVLGGENIDWNRYPGVHIAYRLVEESLDMPALTIGYDWQGYGPYWELDDYDDATQAAINDSSALREDYLVDRYSIKSRGFYAVVSKGYTSILKVGLHAGINLSLEDSDGNNNPTLFMASDILLSRELAFIAEYDFAVNDNAKHGLNDGQGFLNVGLKWAFSHQMSLEFDIKNLLGKENNKPNVRRIIKLVFHGSVQ